MADPHHARLRRPDAGRSADPPAGTVRPHVRAHPLRRARRAARAPTSSDPTGARAAAGTLPRARRTGHPARRLRTLGSPRLRRPRRRVSDRARRHPARPRSADGLRVVLHRAADDASATRRGGGGRLSARALRRAVNILLVSANYRPSVGGIERYTEILASGLVRRGHAVTVLCCQSGEAARTEEIDGVRIVRLPASDAVRRRASVPYPIPHPGVTVRALGRLLENAVVVNPQDALYLTTAASLTAGRLRGVPSVLTQHVSFVPQGSAVLDSAQRIAIRTLGRCARLATRVVAYNPAVAAWARRTWQLDDVPVLPPGVPAAPEVDPVEVRSALGLPADRFLALFVGRDVPKKGLDVFLQAGDPAFELVAVTDRPGGSADGARLLPLMEPDLLRALLASVDAFVLPSEGEGFPLALQEALVSGIPCVVRPGPGYARYLREDEAVFVEPRASAIRAALVRLASNPDDREELARRGKAAGRREFGVDRFVDAYESLYADVSKGGR
ncbi:MAG: hypothetical protein C5B48_03590 [Candidatus Rokuibacteriota bacterium]|nr:MAG: hypothetical protein C5B48_03590 [Candidatus Rokubacteria bacterium]